MTGIGEIQGNYNSLFSSVKNTEKTSGSHNSFQDTLSELVSNVDSQIKESDQLTHNFALGKSNNIHEVMISAEKASLSLKFLMQIRNKLLDGYQEIMRMSF